MYKSIKLAKCSSGGGSVQLAPEMPKRPILQVKNFARKEKKAAAQLMQTHPWHSCQIRARVYVSQEPLT